MPVREIIREPVRETPVFANCDVLVVGGGPAGCAAAASAARAGADTILVERYGCLGGMSTAGLVVWIDRMTDWSGQQIISGFASDLLQRLPENALLGAPEHLWGSKEARAVEYWRDRSSAYHGVITRSPTVDPEMFKIAYLNVLLDRGVKLILHSWAVAPIQEGSTIRGIIFESKSGRQAILARAVIDATGDGDIFALAGTPFECDFTEADENDEVNTEFNAPLNIDNTMNISFLVGGVDMQRYLDFRHERPDEYNRLLKKLGIKYKGHVMPRNDICLFMGPKLSGYSPLSVSDLTSVEIESRKFMMKYLDSFKGNMPGFEDAWIMTTSSQMGTRHSRRLTGVTRMNRDAWSSGRIYKDEIGVTPPPSPRYANVSIPLGSLLPVNLDNLLAAGRNLSCDAVTHSFMREIPVCWVMGQAAGVAAAEVVKADCAVRDVTIEDVRRELVKQGVWLHKQTALLAKDSR